MVGDWVGDEIRGRPGEAGWVENIQPSHPLYRWSTIQKSMKTPGDGT